MNGFIRFGSVAAIVLALHLTARVLPSPVVDFTLDDWAILAKATLDFTWADVARVPTLEPDRPLGLWALFVEFKAFGDRPPLYSAFGALAGSLFLLGWTALVHRLSRDSRITLAAGGLFAVLPNLTESFHWHTMTAYTPGMIGYLISAYLMLGGTTPPGVRRSAAAAVAYLVALATYETGAALPGVIFLFLAGPWRRRIAPLLPFAATMAVYGAWRLTRGFGHAPGLLYTPRDIGISTPDMLWNAVEFARWWIGPHMLTALRDGWRWLLDLRAWESGLLIVLSIAAASVAAVRFRSAPRAESQPHAPWPPLRLALFGIAWAVATAAPTLVSWTGGRMNYLPGAGAVLVAAVILSATPRAVSAPILAVLLLVGLGSSQGTALQWREAGRLQRELYRSITASHASWRDAEILLIDTSELRFTQQQRQNIDSATDSRLWAYLDSAGLYRGFAPKGMVRLAGGHDGRPRTLLDVEHDARWEGDTLDWAERYRFDVRYRTPRESVFTVTAPFPPSRH